MGFWLGYGLGALTCCVSSAVTFAWWLASGRQALMRASKQEAAT
jgi:hypothetical protein